jgi:hypothetical protein
MKDIKFNSRQEVLSGNDEYEKKKLRRTQQSNVMADNQDGPLWLHNEPKPSKEG